MNRFLRLSWSILLFTAGCTAVKTPPEFTYKEIQTRNFNLASWQKVRKPGGVYKFYIEGDGYAYNAHGRPAADPTPHGTMMRELAFGDSSPNVIYLARPCQYIKSPICSPRHWTTARFSPEIVNAEYEAVKQIAGDNEVILTGFSGGAQIVGLISAAKPGLRVKKLITIAGNLDHLAWTQYHHLPPLNESLNLESYQKQYLQIPQIHYAGSEDKVMPPVLIENFVGEESIVVVEGASHIDGWQSIYEQIWQERQ